MKGQIAFEAITNLREEFITEAAEMLGFPSESPHATTKAPRVRGDNLLTRFMNSGWGVAMICAVVSLSVLGGIVWAGQRPPAGGPGGIETGTESMTDLSPGTGQATYPSETDPPQAFISQERAMEIASDYWGIKTGDVADNGFTFRIQSMGTTQTPKGEAVYLIALRWLVELEESSHYSTVDTVWVDMMTGEVIVPYEAETKPDPISCENGHHVTEWTMEREAACFVNGLRNGTCSACNGWVTESIDALPHTYEDGYCTVCGMIEGADERFTIRIHTEEDGSRGGMISLRDGAVGEHIILPNVAYDPQTRRIVPVTAIGSGLFKYDEGLREIIIPDTVHTIGDNAFDHCGNLQNVKLPSSLKKIGDMAFTACNSFTEINLPTSVTEIGDMAFGYCEGITEASIPPDVTVLGDSAFAYCPNLIRVYLPDSLTRLPDSLFQDCTSLTEVRFPVELTHVGNAVFMGCTALHEISFPDSVTSLGYHLFAGCTSLTAFTYPPQITAVRNNQFDDCTSLTRINLHNGITRIEAAFWNCTSLKSIHLPASVTELSGIAFEGCTNLTTLTVDENNPVYTAVGNCIIDKRTGTLVAGGVDAVIPSDGSVTAIGDSAFRGRSIRRITVPDTVTSLGFAAFADCAVLSEITLPEGLKKIEPYAFSGCTSLESMVLPSSTYALGYNVFEKCRNLKAVTLPASLASMGDCVFGECTSLSRVTYTGTKAQWGMLTQGVALGTLEQPYSDFTVYCTDGELTESMS